MVCKQREEIPMQGIHEEEVLLDDTLVEVGVADIDIE
jgi:hypothetical protein